MTQQQWWSPTLLTILLTARIVSLSESLALEPRMGAPFSTPVQPSSRRTALGWLAGASSTFLVVPALAVRAVDDADDKLPETFDVQNYLRTGLVAQPMGVSGQAGKSRPETGVLLRDGSEVQRDTRTGDVLAEILLKPSGGFGGGDTLVPVLASYQSPWPLATGTVFDVECRDPRTGDDVFLQVSSSVRGQSTSELSDAFLIASLVSPTGRFSSYGTPTDVRVRKSMYRDDLKSRVLDVSFSTLSQSTQTEIPRQARVVATIPDGTDQAVLLVASASAVRWSKKGLDKEISAVADSFRAVPAPQTSLRIRAKERRN